MWKNGSVAGVLGPYGDQALSFRLSGSLSKIKALHVWTTNQSQQFVQAADVPVSPGGVVTVSVPPNTLFTLTTTTGQRKGKDNDAGTAIPPAKDFSTYLPLRYDFEGLPLDSLPRFWADMQGAFSVAKEEGLTQAPSGAWHDDGQRAGDNQVMRQNAPDSPTASEGCGSIATTAIGDNSWAFYSISMRARTMKAGGKLYLTSHAGTAHHGQEKQPGMTPSRARAGAGARAGARELDDGPACQHLPRRGKQRR